MFDLYFWFKYQKWLKTLIIGKPIQLVCMKQMPYYLSSSVFPHGHTVAGVFQVSYKTTRNQLEYAYNVSEARELCQVLGVTIASKAQVEEALSRGLETCR